MSKPTIAIQKGASISGADGAVILQLTGLAFLEMDTKPNIKVPEDTDLDIPQEGVVKASSGTETKAGTRIGSPADKPPPGVEIEVPACTLIETAKANKKTDLAEGTKIKTNPGEPPIFVLEEVSVN
jgi:hypothetical protein